MGNDAKQAAARVGDIDTGHGKYPPTPVITGSGDVLINGRPAARMNDMLTSHHPGIRMIAQGSASVRVNGLPAARVTDAINCGGKLAKGSPNVLIGDNPEPVRQGPSAAEFQELIAEKLKPERFRSSPYVQAQLAADIATKYRGEAGAVAAWEEYYRGHSPEPEQELSAVELAGLQGAKAVADAELKEQEALAKGERWRQRQQQIATARDKAAEMSPGTERDRLLTAADRFAQNNVAVEKARLSEDVYEPDDGPPPGWINISDDPEALDRLGLKRHHLNEPDSAFRAQVYLPDPAVFGPDVKPTISFKGSTCREDWANNMAQALDQESLYYRKAVAIGRVVEKIGVDISFTGHSLGGGMSSAAARASGMPAITLNAAGLHPNTVSRYGGVPKIIEPDNVLAVRVKGDILTTVQESKGVSALMTGAGSLVGAATLGGAGVLVGGVLARRTATAIPKATGVAHEVAGRGISPIKRHALKQAIDGLEQQKAEDQHFLMNH